MTSHTKPILIIWIAGSPLQFTFAAATQQAIDLVRANRLTIGTSDEWVLALALAGSQPPWFDTFVEVRQTGAFVTSGRVERRLLAITAERLSGCLDGRETVETEVPLDPVVRNRLARNRLAIFLHDRHPKTAILLSQKKWPNGTR
jgi:hypothetical protein